MRKKLATVAPQEGKRMLKPILAQTHLKSEDVNSAFNAALKMLNRDSFIKEGENAEEVRAQVNQIMSELLMLTP